MSFMKVDTLLNTETETKPNLNKKLELYLINIHPFLG